eukprot:TCONS_00021735-protein
MKIWKKGDFHQLLREAETIQQRLPSTYKKKDLATTSRKFRDMMQKGNVNGAIKLLTNNMRGGVLPLDDNTIKQLRVKHPRAKPADESAILQGPLLQVEPVVFEVIDENLIYKAAQLTKGGSGPSGLDADGWRHILTSRSFGEAGRNLRTALSLVIRHLCTNEIMDDSLQSLMASRLIPLDKMPGVRPIGVGEVLRRIM